MSSVLRRQENSVTVGVVKCWNRPWDFGNAVEFLLVSWSQWDRSSGTASGGLDPTFWQKDIRDDLLRPVPAVMSTVF